MDAGKEPASDDSTEAKNPFSLTATSVIGYESNLLQVAGSQNPIGDGFSQSSLNLALPLDGKNGVFAATLDGSSKLYFSHSELDEYAFTPGLAWSALDDGDTTLKLNIHGGRFQQRIYTEGQAIPSFAYAGWQGGAGWDLESKLSAKSTLSWTGDAGYQIFDTAAQDNFKLDTTAAIATQVKEGLKLTSSFEWTYQDYRVRPFEIISDPLSSYNPPPNPNNLQLLTGRGSEGMEWTLGGGWTLETTLLAGPNLDLTNGYYTAAALGGHAGLRWEAGKWTFKGSVDPELDWYGKRPANLNNPDPKLYAQQYLFTIGIEYAWTKQFHILCTNSIQRQDTNSDTSVPSLNNFIDYTTTIGISLIY